MKCEVVRDLLPLYIDDLCAEETCKEMKEHMEQCQECREKLEALNIPMEEAIEQEEKKEVSIKPMKKVKKKLRRKNITIGIIVFVSILLIGGFSFLGYNQVNRKGISFEVIYEFLHFQYVGRKFAKGDLEPLLNNLAIPGEDDEFAYYAKNAYNKDKDAYIKDTKEYIRQEYQKIFAGKTLKLKRVTSYYQGDWGNGKNYFLIGMVFEVEGIEYAVTLRRDTRAKFYAGDGFSESYDPVTYVADDSEDGTEATSDESDEEDSAEEISDNMGEEESAEDEMEFSNDIESLLQREESLFHALQPCDDMNLFFKKKYIDEYGKREDKTNLLYLSHADMIKEKFLNSESKEEDEYEEVVHKRLEKIKEKGYVLKEFDYSLAGYDKEKHMYWYKISYFFENEEGNKCCLRVNCYRNQSMYNNYMIIIPETEELLGENIPENVEELMMNLWK